MDDSNSSEQKSRPAAGSWHAEYWSCHAKTTVLTIDPTANVTGKRVIAECDTEEDARLIAAAPDLLALLIELVDIEGPLPGNAQWNGKVRDAIAMATGE
ncbi:hypothetical protein [Paraburkholderia caballeronis]|uniref:hypothetical protein n=1 Tax=Paraburkholderia caballeronis TaxID=416943 RepID=UPI000B85C7A4|nr:hypothetical protein [Paraburkholderia caballeronis]